MTQEQKELLLRDLCSRLPYNVKVYDKNGNFNTSYVNLLHINGKVSEAFVAIGLQCRTAPIDEIRPYLFPLSSMTEEQRKELQELHFDYISDEIFNDTEFIYHYDCMHLIDWLNKNHFDWRGLIPLGLAKDATGLGIY